MDIAFKPTDSPVKRNFDFVDTIRCISMMGIVMEHCSVVNANLYPDMLSTLGETSVIQFFKFSTISFFLIGGFLINHKFQEYTALQYLKNRFKKTIKPWLSWMFLFALLTIIDRYIAYSKGSDGGLMVTNFGKYLFDLSLRILFFSPYWFILNFLICISILLIFKKYLYKPWLGASFAICTLFYSINVYFGWVVTTHSTALLGFVFYLWLGVYFNRYYARVMNYINRSSWLLLITMVVLTFVLAVGESTYMNHLGIKDAYNTLRATNILYSLAMFAFLLKVGHINWLQKRLKPRETTFGIYLIHLIVIERGLPLIFQPLKLNYESYNVLENTNILLIRFLLTYAISFAITEFIGSTRARWLIGN